MSKMDPELKAKWIAALRSGEYEQGRGFLKRDDRFCCIGVLCAIQGMDWDMHRLNVSMPPEKFRAGIDKDTFWDLSKANDNGNRFDEIADYIEANL